MSILNIWNVLGMIAILLLILLSKSKNAVWGGLAGGIMVGLIITIIYSFKGNGFPWVILMKGAIIGILGGSLSVFARRLQQK